MADLVTIAQQAVELGCDLAKNTIPSEIRRKSERDVVTDVDIAIEQEVRTFLARMTPEIEFLGEEEGGQSTLLEAEQVWILDPIDGTSNFAHGLPLCAISLSLVRSGEPIVAAIIAPFLDLRYYAAKGQGAFGNGDQLQVSKTTELSHAIVSIGDYAIGPEAATENTLQLRLTALLAERVERIRMFGTAALDLAWLAEGRTDAAIILANKPWDTTAGVLIAREAGASVVDTLNNSHWIRSHDVISVNPHLHHDLLTLIDVALQHA